MLVNIRTINFSRIPWNFRALYGIFTDVPRRFILRGVKEKCYCEEMIDQRRNKFLIKGWNGTNNNGIQDFTDDLTVPNSICRCLLLV